MQQKRRSIAIKLNVLARIVRCGMDKHVAKLNITRSQWTMIAAVAHYPGSTQRIIADALEMSEASAGRLIDKLCAEGYLERRARKDDRRAREVNLTDMSRAVLKDLWAIGEEYEERIFAGFDEVELDQMRDYFDRIYANIGNRCSGGFHRIDEVYREARENAEPLDA